jgi:hypothetical protein
MCRFLIAEEANLQGVRVIELGAGMWVHPFILCVLLLSSSSYYYFD